MHSSVPGSQVRLPFLLRHPAAVRRGPGPEQPCGPLRFIRGRRVAQETPHLAEIEGDADDDDDRHGR